MPTQEPLFDSTHITESQGSLSQLRVEVTGMYLNPNSLIDNCLFSLLVLQAHNIPHVKRPFGRKRLFFVTVTNPVTMKTKSVQVDGQTVHWNQRLGAL